MNSGAVAAHGIRKLVFYTSFLAFAAVLAPAGSAHAHAFSVAYSDVQIADDRAHVTYELRVGLADVGEPLGVDGDPTAADLAQHGDALFRYVSERIQLEGDGATCAPVLQSVDTVDRFARVTWTCGWDHPIGAFALDYDLFFDLDPNHTGMLKVRYEGQLATAPLGADASRFEWELGEPPPRNLFEFVLSGVDHILYGPDHILFLLGLLLIAAIARTGAGPWQPRGVRPGIKYTLAIVSSFTVAHSITLIAAAMGWIALPSRLVESVIALSIIWVAAENIAIADPRRRWLLTFGFGLVHGLGFASMLTPLLPESQVVLPLLAFNIGVELGQLAIVGVAFPVLHILIGRLGPAAYRKYVVVPGSIAVAAMGLVWLIERALGIAIF